MIRKLAVLATLVCTPLLTPRKPYLRCALQIRQRRLRFGLTRSAKNMSAAAEAMPADKFLSSPLQTR